MTDAAAHEGRSVFRERHLSHDGLNDITGRHRLPTAPEHAHDATGQVVDRIGHALAGATGRDGFGVQLRGEQLEHRIDVAQRLALKSRLALKLRELPGVKRPLLFQRGEGVLIAIGDRVGHATLDGGTGGIPLVAFAP